MAEIKLVGSRITKISAERNQDFAGKLQINTQVKIDEIEKIKEAKDTLSVKYEMIIDYAELGKISIEGIIFVTSDSKTLKEIQKSKKEKKFDTDEQVTLSNIILKKASIKAFALEDELGLPVHVQLPSLMLKKK